MRNVHVAVAVEGLDTGQELAVVADGDEDLGVGTDGGLEDGEGSRAELVLLELGDFVLCQLVAGFCEEFLDLWVRHCVSFFSWSLLFVASRGRLGVCGR